MNLATYDMTARSHASKPAGPTVVADLMSTDLVVAPIDLQLEDAMHLMLREHVRHLLVFDGHRLAGLVNDRDLATYQSLAPSGEPIRLDAVVHPPMSVCTPSTALNVVARTMLANRSDATVVMEDTQVVGIFTTVDALRWLAS